MMNRLDVVVLWSIALFGHQFGDVSAFATEIHYSWSGILVPSNTDYPWQLGLGGQPFLLNVTVPFDALDLADLDVEFAAFDVTQARLLLSGQEVPFIGNGTIDFRDNGTGMLDLRGFHGDFRQLGETIAIGSLVTLPMNTIQFSHTIEPPPFFSSTENILRAACCGGPYTSIVAPGSPISVIAEPISIAICGANAFVLMALRRPRETL